MNAADVDQALQAAQLHLVGGRLAEAEALCQQVLAERPEHAGALHLLAGVAMEARRPAEALELLDRSIAVEPNDPVVHVHRGILLYLLERPQEAVACHERALMLKPDMVEAYYWLGRTWREARRVDEATAFLEKAVQLAPDWAVGLKEYGKALFSRQRLREAAQVLERALTLDPNDADAHNTLATILTVVNQMDLARQHLERAVALDPNYAMAVDNLGFALSKAGRLEEARRLHERALELQPGYANAYNNLGFIYRNLLQPDKAIEYTRLGVAAKPESARYGSDLVLSAYYHPDFSREQVATELRGWNERYGAPKRPFRQPHDNDRNPARRLRVGYVSPDLGNHVISHFMLPLLEAHDPAQVEIHCYASVAVSDVLTRRAQRVSHGWHEVRGLSDQELAERVRVDGIDILVDLSVHTGDNRLEMFAYKPAPVQVSWLGFAGSTGLETMDYRFTDPRIDPVGANESWSSETTVRLPDVWCCFSPLHEMPPVAPLPALRNGYVTFGSLNSFVKVNAPTLRRWARALRVVERSRLLMHVPDSVEARAAALAVLAEEGIAAERVEFVGWQKGEEYLRTYDRIDVGLDPFPFNGMTTTCDAMWRGVPVLALPGELSTSRTGLSLMSVVGLEGWVARDEAEYERKARELTGNLTKLQRLRAGLRRRMQESALADAPRFARNVESAYRRMWQAWTEGRARESMQRTQRVVAE